MHPLDKPVWASLTSHHLTLSEGGTRARRFLADVNLFAATCDDSELALRDLAQLVKPNETIFLAEVPSPAFPSDFDQLKIAVGVQMVATRRMPHEADGNDVLTLGADDAPDMLALATLTEPGPFLKRTHAMGNFLGIRIGGRLAAMAGERMRFPGYTEVSGVCTHPDFRGRGLARRLSAAVARRIEARGEQPFLHAWKANQAAIALYQGLGFAHRADVVISVLRRRA